MITVILNISGLSEFPCAISDLRRTKMKILNLDVDICHYGCKSLSELSETCATK